MFNALMLLSFLSGDHAESSIRGKSIRSIAFVTEQENRFGKSFNRFTDISRLDSVDLNFNYVFHVALYRRLSRRGRTIIKSAFLVPNAGGLSIHEAACATHGLLAPEGSHIQGVRSCRGMARCSS